MSFRGHRNIPMFEACSMLHAVSYYPTQIFFFQQRKFFFFQQRKIFFFQQRKIFFFQQRKIFSSDWPE